MSKKRKQTAFKSVVTAIVRRLRYLVLLLAAFFLSKGAINEYRESKTNFAETEEHITLKDLPTVTICYYNTNLTTQPRIDFKGYYYPFYPDPKDISIMLSRENVSVTALKTIFVDLHDKEKGPRSCQKVTPDKIDRNQEIDHGYLFRVYLDFDPNTKGPERYLVYMTSEDNAYGVVKGRWYDGEVSSFGVVSATLLPVYISRIEENHYIAESCQSRSYYQALGQQFAGFDIHQYKNLDQKVNDECPFPPLCSPISLPCDIPVCNTDQKLLAEKCYEPALDAIAEEDLEEYNENHLKSCVLKEFKADIVNGKAYLRANHSTTVGMTFQYQFQLPEAIRRVWTNSRSKHVRREYYVVTGIELMGIVGGTMGLFIGFSFVEFSAWAMHHILKAGNWISKQK